MNKHLKKNKIDNAIKYQIPQNPSFQTNQIPLTQGVSVIQQVSYSPLPSAREMQEYQSIGLQEEILSLIHTQASHRREIENKHLNAQITHLEAQTQAVERRDEEAMRGQIFALIISIFAISIALC